MADLAERMKVLRTSAVLRSKHGVIIGGSEKCDGGCDSRCRGWHWWVDMNGEELRPEDVAGGSNCDEIE